MKFTERKFTVRVPARLFQSIKIFLTLNGKERAGNYVIIQNENRFIMLAHLRPNSIKINKYDSVKVNDYIGEAGNSGYSIEPHLHIEVHEQISSNTIPVSIMFDNEFYTYNDVIKR
jgi:murein DD-endopeptidase MepM/ murein hydrolase activator NlpD